MTTPDFAAIRAREEADRLARFLTVLRTSPNAVRRAGVVEAAGKGALDVREIVPLALADVDPKVRAAGARAAGARSMGTAHDSLLQLASSDDDADVRMESIVALERLGLDYPELTADLPAHARRELPELRRVVRRPFGITWRRTWTAVVAAVLAAGLLEALRRATDGRSDVALAVLGGLSLAMSLLYRAWSDWRGDDDRSAP